MARWTNEDLQVLLDNYALRGTEYCARLLGKSPGSIRTQVYNLKKSGRKLTEIHPQPMESVPVEVEQREQEEEDESVIQALRLANSQLRKQIMDQAAAAGGLELFRQAVVDNCPHLTIPAAKLGELITGHEHTGELRVGHEKEMVVVLSDCHAGESWTKDQTDGASEYNFEKFKDNLYFLGQELMRFGQQFGSEGCDTLHVDCLGDVVQGTLRIEDEVTNDFEIIPTVMKTARVIYQWLAMLLGEFTEIQFTGIAGNHGRMTKKPENRRFVETNFDTLVYTAVEAMFSVSPPQFSRRIKFSIPSSRVHVIDRCGHRVRLMHGDTIRGGNGISSIPLYGISRDQLRAFRRELRQHGGALDLIEMGHFHTPSLLEGVVMMNGALCPPDPYAINELGASGHPTQWVYLTSVDHVYGWTMPVSLKDAPPHHFQED